MSNLDRYEDFDSSFYIAFGGAITANILGLLLSPVLLIRDWKKNSIAVASNIFLIISNCIAYGQYGISDCNTAGNAVQFFMIAGSLAEVLAPICRSYLLFDKTTGYAMRLMVVMLIISEFCSFANIQYICNNPKSQFAYIRINVYSEVFSNLLGIVIYAVSFYQIIKVINSSELTRQNSRMQVVKKMALGCIYSTCIIKLGCLLGYILVGEGDNDVEMALKSGLSCAIIICVLFLELATKAKDSVENSRITGEYGTKSVKHAGDMPLKSMKHLMDPDNMMSREFKSSRHLADSDSIA